MPESAPIHSIKYGRATIRFSLRFTNRKTLGISVHPDLSVTVTAPLGTELETINRKVRKRASWILKQQDDFARFLPALPPPRYVSGESHYYLGRQYRLKVEKAAEESVKLKNGRLLVRLRDTSDAGRVKTLLDEWYRNRARERFQSSLVKCLEKLRRIEAPPIKLRKMARRWGSCTRGGTINLNPELVKAPSHCIDYVVTHELCHLVYPHHGSEFYALLTRIMPDWKLRKQRLERVVVENID